ncbi:MAG: cold shock domain-containing protein [Daejeonella sp.]|uniref:cold-shock protein n=1 Tax=Daejeonella sp. TaxID=2805397 RepID=UPI003C759D88
MATGKVKWFNTQKGYGFIVNDEDNKEIFVHFKDIDGGANSIRENDEVEFTVEEGKKGLQATHVRRTQ